MDMLTKSYDFKSTKMFQEKDYAHLIDFVLQGILPIYDKLRCFEFMLIVSDFDEIMELVYQCTNYDIAKKHLFDHVSVDQKDELYCLTINWKGDIDIQPLRNDEGICLNPECDLLLINQDVVTQKTLDELDVQCGVLFYGIENEV